MAEKLVMNCNCSYLCNCRLHIVLVQCQNRMATSPETLVTEILLHLMQHLKHPEQSCSGFSVAYRGLIHALRVYDN